MREEAELIGQSVHFMALERKELGLSRSMRIQAPTIVLVYVELDGDYGHDSFLFHSDEYAVSLKNFLESNE